MLKLLSKIYEYIAIRRNQAYFSKKLRTYECSVPVISVGNISVGGSGKTPFTILLANELKKMGFLPAIIGRGYKKKKKGIVVLCDGINILSNAASGGDEMLLIAEKTMLPVIACEKKYLAARYAENNFDIDVIIVDDGFQHLQLARNINIALIASDDLQKPYTIPYGRLREPLSSLSRADIICITSDMLIDNNTNKFYDNKIIIKYRKEIGTPYLIFNDDNNKGELAKDYKYVAFCGIANPESFYKSLIEEGFNIEKFIMYKDHKFYRKFDIYRIIKLLKQKNIKNLLTTEKDAVKINEYNHIFKRYSILVYAVPMEIIFDIDDYPKIFDFIYSKL